MKKTVNIAFAIALVILSIIATLFPTEIINNIIYAIIVPSFILSIISLFNDLSDKCEEEAINISADSLNKANQCQDDMKSENKKFSVQKNNNSIIEFFHEQKITELHNNYLTYRESEYVAKRIQVFCQKSKKIFDRICLVGYVILFICLSLSPYITKFLTFIDLNCISLWSLTLLYFSLELKPQICNVIYNQLSKVYQKQYVDAGNG